MADPHSSAERQIKSALYLHFTQREGWADKRMCLRLSGPRGSGKTATVLNTFAGKRHFYFSFRGLCSESAKMLLAAELAALGEEWTDSSWQSIFTALDGLGQTWRIFIFDDLDEMMLEKDFVSALQSYLDDSDRRRVFLILIHTVGRPLTALSLLCKDILTTYGSIADIKKAHPNRTGTEVVEVFTLSGGIARIADEFCGELSVDETAAKLLSRGAHFRNFAWEVLSAQFRRPETYAFILHALALGHSRISEVGKFTGYAYNKCDKYIKALMEDGLVAAVSRDGKTAYEIANSYFRIWFQYIYPNQRSIETGDFSTSKLGLMLSEVREHDVPAAFTAACFAALDNRISDDLPPALRRAVKYRPMTVTAEGVDYTFDYAGKSNGKAVFVKIFHDDEQSVGKEEFEKIERAVMACHPFYDSQIYLFAKRRFSDYLVHEASNGIVKLFNLERLRFVE